MLSNISIPNKLSTAFNILLLSIFPCIAWFNISSISIFSKNSPDVYYFELFIKSCIPNSSCCSCIASCVLFELLVFDVSVAITKVSGITIHINVKKINFIINLFICNSSCRVGDVSHATFIIIN